MVTDLPPAWYTKEGASLHPGPSTDGGGDRCILGSRQGNLELGNMDGKMEEKLVSKLYCLCLMWNTGTVERKWSTIAKSWNVKGEYIICDWNKHIKRCQNLHISIPHQVQMNKSEND
ncbi:hypothetical protein DPMN_123377 [Dreissena polymorpha]|uniref:Uncharacterized protein n=1 Tax=Dreissena polymorpha TaxID=45954 RepID=A0A9D4GXB9_DREPO|nr:hypothetical protein DPMN_123377 [Dreissena polymorpha]